MPVYNTEDLISPLAFLVKIYLATILISPVVAALTSKYDETLMALMFFLAIDIMYIVMITMAVLIAWDMLSFVYSSYRQKLKSWMIC